MKFPLAHGEVIPGAQTETKSDLWAKRVKGVLREYPAHSRKLETHCVWHYTSVTAGRSAQA